MYGYHDLPYRVEEEGISISIEKEGKNWRYKRTLGQQKVDKLILGENNRLLINPVEPLNLPKEITSFLLIQFETPILVGPGTKTVIYLTFPIEIGFILVKNGQRNVEKNFETLDIVSVAKQKFTLYGEISNGIVCRYWKSPVYTSIPDSFPSPLYEGILELLITNPLSSWATISKTVLDAYGMTLFYNRKVCMKAWMVIKDKYSAETDFQDSSLKVRMEEVRMDEVKTEDNLLEADMQQSIQLYQLKKLTVLPTKFLMEWGI